MAHKFECLSSSWMIEKYGNEVFCPGLERIRPLFEAAVSKIQSQTKIITLAGTNGKGETAHALMDLLIDRNCNVALWTSPHILKLTERFICNRNEIGEELLLELLKENRQKHIDTGIGLSFYEALFYTFVNWVGSLEVDYVILEVGLGGRLDAVNLFDADYVGLSSISRDHQELLGETEELILKEKLGVLREKSQFIYNLEQESLKNLIKAAGIPALCLFSKGITKLNDTYSIRNKILAYSLSQIILEDEVNLNREGILAFLKKFPFNLTLGRQQQVTLHGKRFIFIGAHNVDGVSKFFDSLSIERKQQNQGILIMSFSARPKSELGLIGSTVKKNQALFEHVVLTSFSHRRAAPKEVIQEIAKDLELNFEDNWQDIVKNTETQKEIWVAGSYYFISEIMHTLN